MMTALPSAVILSAISPALVVPTSTSSSRRSAVSTAETPSISCTINQIPHGRFSVFLDQDLEEGEACESRGFVGKP